MGWLVNQYADAWGAEAPKPFTELSRWRCASGNYGSSRQLFQLFNRLFVASNTQKWSTGVTNKKKKREEKKRKTQICLVLSRHFWPSSVCWAVASLRRILGVDSNIIISSLNSFRNGRIWDYCTFGLSQIKLSHSGDESLPARVRFAALGMKTLKTRVQSRKLLIEFNILIDHEYKCLAKISESISSASRLCLSLLILCRCEHFYHKSMAAGKDRSGEQGRFKQPNRMHVTDHLIRIRRCFQTICLN